MANEKLKINTALKATRASFDQNRAVIVRLSLGFAALSALASLLDVTGPAGLAVSFGVTLLLGAGFGGLITAVVCLPGETGEVPELWASVKPVLARLIWATLVIGVAVLAGVFLLIIPGLILLTIWSVASQTIVVEGKGVFDALGRSTRLVRHSAWQVFGFLVVIALLGLLLLALTVLIAAPLGDGAPGTLVGSFLGNLLTTPLLAIAAAVLYNQLVGIETAGRETAAEAPPSA